MLPKQKLLGTWENKEHHQNYYWQQTINNSPKKQQISLEQSTCLNRGNYKVNFAVWSIINAHIDLNNYFFIKEIATEEIINWAEIINNTGDLNYEATFVEINKADVLQTEYFVAILCPVSLIFANGYQVNIWRFDIRLIDDRCQIDANDFFPRYYTHETFARIEQNNWMDLWTLQYLNLNN